MKAKQPVVFVPHTQRQCTALVKYIAANRPAIEARRKTAEYKQAVGVVREIMAQYFAGNPPQPIVEVCPWQTLGASKMLADIATQFEVPYWNCSGDANPYA